MLIQQQNLARNVFLRVFKSAKTFQSLNFVLEGMSWWEVSEHFPIYYHFHNIAQQKHGHRGSHDKITACDWLDTLHRGSKWQEVTIFSNIRTADRGSKSQSHFTNILRTKNDQLRVVLGCRRSKHSTFSKWGVFPTSCVLGGFPKVLNLFIAQELHLLRYLRFYFEIFLKIK
jgi:hypothetical protein